MQPTVATFTLGAGYRSQTDAVNFIPLAPSQVAQGQTAYSAFESISSGTSALDAARSFVAPSAFSAIFPPDPRAAPSGVAYAALSNGNYQPNDWSERASTATLDAAGKSGLVFYEAIRDDRGWSALLLATRGPDWALDPSVDQYVDGANDTRYLAFSFQLIFDSACKRDTFLAKAGASAFDALLPAKDDKGLGNYLVDAKAQMAIHVIALGQAAATQAVLDATKCATDHLAECRALVQSLDALAKRVGSAPLPPAFIADAKGNGDWFVDSVSRTTKQYLR